MRKLLILLFVLGLGACTSPALNMPDAQIRNLSDDQLCEMQNNYRSEWRVETEITGRGLNCDRHFRECLRRGNKPNTPAMDFCVDLVRENERLRYDEPAWAHFGIWGHEDYDRLRSVR